MSLHQLSLLGRLYAGTPNLLISPTHLHYNFFILFWGNYYYYLCSYYYYSQMNKSTIIPLVMQFKLTFRYEKGAFITLVRWPERSHHQNTPVSKLICMHPCTKSAQWNNRTKRSPVYRNSLRQKCRCLVTIRDIWRNAIGQPITFAGVCWARVYKTAAERREVSDFSARERTSTAETETRGRGRTGSSRHVATTEW